MSVFARAVVGVDGTEWGFEALRQTLVLVEPDSSVLAVTALDVRPAYHTGFEAGRWAETLEQEAATTRDEAEAILDGRAGSQTLVAAGGPLQVLRKARDESEATLVSLGGRHSSRFLGIMLGETAAELLHDDVGSVLLARPQPGATWQPRRVVVGLDGSDGSLAALDVAEDLAARLGAAVEIVAATGGKPERADGDWRDRVDAWDDAHPVAALVGRSAEADLLVVGSRGLHGVRSLGSVSERVAHQARCSVLVVQIPRAS